MHSQDYMRCKIGLSESPYGFIVSKLQIYVLLIRKQKQESNFGTLARETFPVLLPQQNTETKTQIHHIHI